MSLFIKRLRYMWKRRRLFGGWYYNKSATQSKAFSFRYVKLGRTCFSYNGMEQFTKSFRFEIKINGKMYQVDLYRWSPLLPQITNLAHVSKKGWKP